jgi:hypothetical protein
MGQVAALDAHAHARVLGRFERGAGDADDVPAAIPPLAV